MPRSSPPSRVGLSVQGLGGVKSVVELCVFPSPLPLFIFRESLSPLLSI